jgi:hypothetical protein
VGRLDLLDLGLELTTKEEAERLRVASVRLVNLRLALGRLTGEKELGPPVCVLFEGWDASGKGGAIKRLVSPLDPRHVRVVEFVAPTPDEKRHHFLRPFWPVLPGWEAVPRGGRGDAGAHPPPDFPLAAGRGRGQGLGPGQGGETVCHEIELGMAAHGLKVPKPPPVKGRRAG